MYAHAAFYLEIKAEHVPGGGWNATATFSRKRDYRRHFGEVTKTRYSVHIDFLTKDQAIRETLQWARKFVDSSADVIESSLYLEEKFTKLL